MGGTKDLNVKTHSKVIENDTLLLLSFLSSHPVSTRVHWQQLYLHHLIAVTQTLVSNDVTAARWHQSGSEFCGSSFVQCEEVAPPALSISKV